ncbi:MAG: tRNA(Ile)-lysidine synthetase, partial [Nitrospira sp.]|nr:tRNA(Ile)-lysidine synthetase [Nitrospira sp.]
TERELAAYCVLTRIDYVVEECPMAQGARTLLYKDVLNRLETHSPGTKQSFYWGFLETQGRSSRHPQAMAESDQALLHPCLICGQPTITDHCSYCKLMVRAKQMMAH